MLRHARLKCTLFAVLLVPGLFFGLRSSGRCDCGDQAKTAEGSFQNAEASYDAGKFHQALEAYDRAFSTDIYCRPGKALMEIVGGAMALEALGEFTDALDRYRKGLAFSVEIFGPSSPETAASNNFLGKILVRMGMHEDARASFERALDISVRVFGPDSRDTSIALNNLASTLEIEGEYQKALEYYEKSLDIRLKVLGPDHPATATALNNVGGIYKTLGQHEKALEYLLKALPIYVKTSGPEHPDTAGALNNIGSVYQALKKYPEALENYRAALAINMKTYGPEHPETGLVLNNIAAALEVSEEFDQALEHYKKALKIFRNAFGPNHPATARTYNNIGSVYLSLEQYPAAFNAYREALPAAQRSGEAHLRWSVLAGLSWTVGKMGRLQAAILFGKQAVNVIQTTRSSLASLDKAVRKSYMDDKTRVYRRLAFLLTEAGRILEAQRVLDLLKEEEYIAFVRGNDNAGQEGVGFSEAEKPWADKFSELGDHIAKRGAEFAELRKRAKSGDLTEEDRNREKEILSDLEKASRSFEAFLDRITEEFEKTAGEKAAELTEKGLRDLKSLQSTLRYLGNGAVVVHYLMADDKLIIILTTPETQLAREAPVQSSELSHLISDLRKDLVCPAKDPRPAAKKLYDKVFAPIARDLEEAGAKTLLLSLDGTMRYVPFACLHDGEKYLIEKYATVVFTSAGRDKLRIPPVNAWTVAGFGVSEKVSDRFSALPSVRDELKSIVQTDGQGGVLPGIIKMDRDFTLDAMRGALLRDYQVIHIASHFVFNPTDTESFLLLGDGSRLSLDQIKHQGFRFDEVELLTLSACETGLGIQEANGREIEGFATLAQRNGARGVIATLWSVADKSTGALMRKMYAAHAASPGANKAECLRRAQLELLRGAPGEPAGPAAGSDRSGSADSADECARGRGLPFDRDPHAPYAHPYFWAPFVLMGNFL